MIFVLLICVGLLIPVLEDKIRKHAGLWYLGTIGLSAISLAGLILWRKMPCYKLVLEVFGRGTLATALFIYVMIASVLPTGKTLTKAIYRIRGELAIMAAFLILPHNIYFGRTYFVRLFRNPGSLATPYFLAAICSLVMLLLLIPLTITSFKKVRRKMKAKNWKRLQRFSYLFYGLLYLHVMLVLIPHSEGNWQYVAKEILYTVLFGTYAVLRVRKYLVKKKAAPLTQKGILPSGICVVAAVSVCLILSGLPQKEGAAETAEVTDTSEQLAEVSDLLTEVSQLLSEASGLLSEASGLLSEAAVSQAEESDALSEAAGLLTEASELLAGETEESGLLQDETEASLGETEDLSDESETEDALDLTEDLDDAAEAAETSAEDSDDKAETTGISVENAEDSSGKGDGSSEGTDSETGETEAAEASAWKDGVYTGIGDGYLGDVEVEVTITDGIIESVKIIGYEDDPDYFTSASVVIPKKIVESQSTDVDAVSGATFSSEGILEAVENALAEAAKER